MGSQEIMLNMEEHRNLVAQIGWRLEFTKVIHIQNFLLFFWLSLVLGEKQV